MSDSRRRRSEGDESPRRPTKAERRRQLLAAARAVFTHAGYRAATVEQVAATAGVSMTALLRHFADKSELLAGLVAELVADLFPDAVEAEGPADPLTRLHVLVIRFLSAARTERPLVGLILGTLAAADPDDVNALSEFVTGAEDALIPLIEDGQQAGVFRRTLEPRRAAGELLCSLLGLALIDPLTGPTSEPEQAAVMLDCLLHGLLKTDI